MTGERRLLDSVGPPWRTPAIDLNAAVSSNVGPIVLGLVVVVIALVLVVIALARRLRSIDARLRLLTRGDEGDLEDVLGAHLDRVHVLGREVERLIARTGRLESIAPRAFQRVGLVRFNPFEDTGGNQSFALALLDAEGNGWVLSSLHARSGTRVYAKAIHEGRSEGALSDEEAAAIKQATA
ncbi:MAG TPA: DUF4446 family protein [Candidatus Limnocylindrales bacterium]|nr:DUF4446 family protein [Candidatus Limnocylindrales bacterium]